MDDPARSCLSPARGPVEEKSVRLDAVAPGRWSVDGLLAPHLHGYLDVDLEFSAMTNAFPIHRLGLAVGDRAEVPAVYVRSTDLSVEVLEQTYDRIADHVERQSYLYSAPAFDFRCEIAYDESGLVVDYPGVAVRSA